MNARNSIRWLLDDCSFYRLSPQGKPKISIEELTGELAYHAMMLEAHLTPKAGLVDCISQGAHRDMSISTFVRSSEALRPFMKAFVIAGSENHHLRAADLLPCLKQVGLEAEVAMFNATDKVNTHKGMIFTLGLICGAVGWLYRRKTGFNAGLIREVIQACCADLVNKELKSVSAGEQTAGERIFRQYGLSGVRGEAAMGYPTIFNYGLPVYQACISRGCSEEQALSKTLLSLMAQNSDSNLISRGGLTGLKYVQCEAHKLFIQSDRPDFDFESAISGFDQQLIDRNLSPGGSADLLAATWLLAQLNICSA